MSEEKKIITLGDIFKNIETEEKAFKFKDYIKDLQQKVDRLNNILDGLEKYIKAEIPEEEFVNSELYVNILDKLKTLKENNK